VVCAKRQPHELERVMKSHKSPLASFERIAHSHGHGILLAGIVLLSAWLGGHSALYRAYRSVELTSSERGVGPA
jgi:hypothetical protein